MVIRKTIGTSNIIIGSADEYPTVIINFESDANHYTVSDLKSKAAAIAIADVIEYYLNEYLAAKGEYK